MIQQVVKLGGKRYVMVEQEEFRRLHRLAQKAETIMETAANALPAYPPADKNGNRPAAEFARVSIARRLVEERTGAGLTQQELAKLSGLRQETISRLESGKHSPTVRTIDRIIEAIAAHRKAARKKNRK